MLLHISVSFLGLAIRNWKADVLHRFRIVGVGGLLAVLSLHLDFEHFHHEPEDMLSLVCLVGAFILMALAHKFSSHKTHHHDCCESEAHPFISSWWVGALFIHSMSDGYLLGISEGFSADLRQSVWAFLIVHKVLEALWVSGLLAIEYKKSNLIRLIGIYILTFPVGYMLPHILVWTGASGSKWPEHIVEMAGSLSMGSLLACVLVDQIIPSVKNIKKDFKQLLWLVAGFALTHGVLLLSGSEHHAH